MLLKKFQMVSVITLLGLLLTIYTLNNRANALEVERNQLSASLTAISKQSIINAELITHRQIINNRLIDDYQSLKSSYQSKAGDCGNTIIPNDYLELFNDSSTGDQAQPTTRTN